MAGTKALGIRGVWCGPEDAGRTAEEVSAFADRLDRAHINLVAMCVKGGNGIFWPSRRFPEATSPTYRDFDMPSALLAECRKRGIMAHAWFIDFMEGPDSLATTTHPEWLMRNAEGGTARSETLRGGQYSFEWMCPARRPGYTDQWLIPMMAEFAEKYDFDAIHHDYIRYPGDLAPDRYCFCDYCLEQVPRFAGCQTAAFPNEPFDHDSYDRPYIESHWEQSPRVLPANWARLSRSMKSRFLLEGSFFAGGRNDLDYFFYLYRTDAINRFAREAAEAIRTVRPGMKVSAAVFKNPVHSGRFIGQDWRQFAGSVDIAMPMDYRDHYPGDFETYLTLLAETFGEQTEWARDYGALWPGIAVSYLYYEEERPLRQIAKLLERGAGVEEIGEQLAAVSAGLHRFAPVFLQRLSAWIEEPSDSDRAALIESVQAFLKAPPRGYRPEGKLIRTIETVRDSGASGICIFSAGLLTRYAMWDAARDAFAPDRAATSSR